MVFLFVTVVFGLVQGMQPIVGYNWGARKNERVWKVLRYTILAATAITTPAAITGECVPGYVTRIFGAGEELTAVAERAFRIIVVMFPIVGAQMVIGNFFQSIGHAGKSIFLSLSRQLLLLLPLLAVLPPRYGLDGVWMSMPISDGISFFLATGLLTYQIIKMRRHETDRVAK